MVGPQSPSMHPNSLGCIQEPGGSICKDVLVCRTIPAEGPGFSAVFLKDLTSEKVQEPLGGGVLGSVDKWGSQAQF